ncbi:hypothetical protein SDC9_195995 [bioreactor metagenome]|uniref:Uncharacterized protein n=1 Tax=bioreactor metagenome TaxID=1076179 RepID=A0A645IAU3_9ZZZZ
MNHVHPFIGVVSNVLDHVAQRGAPGDGKQRTVLEERLQIDRRRGTDVLLALLKVVAAGRDDDMANAKAILNALCQLDAERGDVVDANLYNAGGNGALEQARNRWARNMHLLGDLLLRVTFQIVELGDLDQQIAFFIQRLRHSNTPYVDNLNIVHRVSLVKGKASKCYGCGTK